MGGVPRRTVRLAQSVERLRRPLPNPPSSVGRSSGFSPTGRGFDPPPPSFPHPSPHMDASTCHFAFNPPSSVDFPLSILYIGLSKRWGGPLSYSPPSSVGGASSSYFDFPLSTFHFWIFDFKKSKVEDGLPPPPPPLVLHLLSYKRMGFDFPP